MLLLRPMMALLLLGPILLPPSAHAISTTWDTRLDELVGYLQKEAPTPLDWTRGTFLAVQLFSAGTNRVPRAKERFESSGVPEECLLSGLHLALHGSSQDHFELRSALETDETKRAWLRRMVGTEEHLVASLEEGRRWQTVTRALPATDGPDRLVLVLTRSRDPMVRRLGLHMGYWNPAPQYWKIVRFSADHDPDELTRRFSAYLLRQREKPGGEG